MRGVFLSLLLVSCAGQGRAPEPQPLPLDPAFWRVEYATGGSVFFPFHPAQSLWLSSAAPDERLPTRSALLLSRETFPEAGYVVEVEFALVEQHRAGRPNPWETFWLFFDYQPVGPDAKTTNYVVIKPNGIEVGRAWGEIDQAFLLTRESPKLVPERWTRLRLESRLEEVRFFLNGAFAASVPRSALYQQPGHLGLYVEDAHVRVRSVRVGY